MKTINDIYKSVILLIIFILLITKNLYALNTKNVRAYPVPLNPKTNSMTIDDPSGALAAVNSVKIYIYDINGDLVISRTYNGLPVLWNGRNDLGRYVKPGLYILKLVFEDPSGGYGRKLIRILVNY